MDIEQFVKRFENDSRDIYVKRKDITRAVGLRPGDAVADIGAGTGLFTLLFAEQVGQKGTVYAVDIGPAFLKYIAEQAKKHEYEKVIKTVLNTQDSTELPAGSIDVAFICDTYHHFEHPEKMLASIHRALRPGGRLIIIDFDLRKDSGDFVKQRARASKEVYYKEIGAAGFELIDVKNAPAIKDNFYCRIPASRTQVSIAIMNIEQSNKLRTSDSTVPEIGQLVASGIEIVEKPCCCCAAGSKQAEIVQTAAQHDRTVDSENARYAGGRCSASGHPATADRSSWRMASTLWHWSYAVSSRSGAVCSGQSDAGITSARLGQLQIELRPPAVAIDWN